MLLTPAVQQGNFGERAAFGSVRDQGCRALLAGKTGSLALCPVVNNIINQRTLGTSRFNHPVKIVDYKEATDGLFGRITAEDLAAELGVSQNAVARARLDPDSRGYRPPPAGWENGVAQLARARAKALLTLATEVEGRPDG